MKPIDSLQIEDQLLDVAQKALQGASSAEDGFGMLEAFFSTFAPLLSNVLVDSSPLIVDFTDPMAAGLKAMTGLAGIAKDVAKSMVGKLMEFPDIHIDLQARLLISGSIANDPRLRHFPGANAVIAVGVDRVFDAVASGAHAGYQVKMEFVFAAASQLVFKRSRSCTTTEAIPKDEAVFGVPCQNCIGKAGSPCVINGIRMATCNNLGQCSSGGKARLGCGRDCVQFNGFVRHIALNTVFCPAEAEINKVKIWIDPTKEYFLFWCSKYSHYRIAKMASFENNRDGHCFALTLSKSVSYMGPNWEEFLPPPPRNEAPHKPWLLVDRVLARCTRNPSQEKLPLPQVSQRPNPKTLQRQTSVDLDQGDSSPSTTGDIDFSNYEERLLYAPFTEPAECGQEYEPISDLATCKAAVEKITTFEDNATVGNNVGFGLPRIQDVIVLDPAPPPYFHPFGCWFWSSVFYDPIRRSDEPPKSAYLGTQKSRYTADLPLITVVCVKRA